MHGINHFLFNVMLPALKYLDLDSKQYKYHITSKNPCNKQIKNTEILYMTFFIQLKTIIYSTLLCGTGAV